MGDPQGKWVTQKGNLAFKLKYPLCREREVGMWASQRRVGDF